MHTTQRLSHAQIDHHLAILHAKSEVVKRQETDLQRLLDSLRIERLQLEEQCTDFEAQRWPINWLPYDLLVRVFELCLEFDEPSDADDQRFYFRPVQLSHVCRKWRAAALSVSKLWSRVLLGRFRQRDLQNSFIARSGKSPLELVHLGPAPQAYPSPDVEGMDLHTDLFPVLPHLPRCASMAVTCKSPLAMQCVIGLLDRTRPLHIETLKLAISQPCPNFRSISSWLGADAYNYLNSGPHAHPSTLTHLTLLQVPPLAVPTYLLSNLRFVELNLQDRVQLRSRASRAHCYTLSIRHLCKFLSMTPLLEELLLSDTVPFMDVQVREQESDDRPGRISPVALPNLRRIEWSYPRRTVSSFLEFLDAPSLERLDLCLDESKEKRTRAWIDHSDSMSEDKLVNGMLVPRIFQLRVKELNVQCVDEDTLGLAFRKIAFPALEKLELSYVGLDDVDIPGLPRLESIFRDPRLPHLKSLTLSHFKLIPEQVPLLLGYMPSLEHLILDTCVGADVMLDILAAGPAGGGLTGVRACPKLESLAIWGCDDVEFATVRALVRRRSLVCDSMLGISSDDTPSNTEGPTDAGSESPRKIKPLRKRAPRGVQDRFEVASPPHPHVLLDRDPIATAMVMVLGDSIMMQHPARLRTLRIAGCKGITEEEAMTLRDAEFGLKDVAWES